MVTTIEGREGGEGETAPDGERPYHLYSYDMPIKEPVLGKYGSLWSNHINIIIIYLYSIIPFFLITLCVLFQACNAFSG